MKRVFLIAQILLAIIFLVFGANGLISMTTGKLLIPLPPATDEFKSIMAGLFAAKYIMPTVKIIEVLAGALLVVNKYSNLALILLGPIIFNILFLHVFTNPAGIVMSAVILVLWLACVYSRRNQFKSFLLKM